MTITPRVGTLSLSCTPMVITGTSNVGCTLTSSLPSYTTNIVWTWTDASPASESPSCQFGCWFMSRSWAGTVTVTANVNGDEQTVTSQIKRRCASDSVLEDSSRLAALADVWYVGGDLTASGDTIPIGQRQEAGTVGSPSIGYPPANTMNLPCRWDFAADVADYEMMHSHPFRTGTSIPASYCFSPPNDTGNITLRGSFSFLDAISIARTRNIIGHEFRGFVIDADSIYYLNGSDVGGIDSSRTITVRDSTHSDTAYVFGLQDTVTFRNRTHRFGRTGAYGCTLP